MFEKLNNSVKSGIRNWLMGGGPPSGQIVRYDPNLDSMRSQLTKTITIARLDTILRNADDGDITEALELFAEMEPRDPRLKSVAATRRRAVTGLKWEIVSAAELEKEGVDTKLAEEAAGYVRKRLDTIQGPKKGQNGFKTGLRHLAKAIGPNLAVLELVWQYGELVKIEPIDRRRLMMRPEKSPDVRVMTAEDRYLGVVAENPKFVVHVPEAVSGSPLSESLCQAQAFLWLYKKLALSDWGTFCEIFGMPVRVGRYQQNATPAEKTQLKDMLQNMGSSAWAMISQAVELIFAETGTRGTAPFEAFMNYLSRETSILWTGANLVTDTTGGTGTFAAASVQDEVRDDLRDADIEAEAETVRQQIFGPMVEYRFPGMDAPVPYFQRQVPEDSKQVAETVVSWQGTGLTVPAKWARRQSGIPEPEEGEEVLSPPDAFEEGLAEG